jgi:eukaryotic-like serine/threonine-protein kinase
MPEHHPPITVGRYLLHRKIARGGMATIHIARLMGDVGFSRIVAAKRMHPELAEDKEFVAMFLDEARIASKVHHRNVVPVLDVVTMPANHRPRAAGASATSAARGDEVVLVQEYVHGAPLSLLLRTSCEAKTHVPIPVAATLACQVLAGLHAAHETVDEMGTPLHVVHRDVSPQNIMVATDGSARLLDFGVAKAALAAHVTRKGTFKGKLSYSSPEQIRGEANRQSDIYALGVVLWELVVGQRLHPTSLGETVVIGAIMSGRQPTVTDALADEKSWIGSYRWSQLEALEPIIRKALDVNHRRRWTTAADMEEAIAAAVPLASCADVASWLRAVGKDFLDARETMIAEEEASWRRTLAMTEQAVELPADAVPLTVGSQPSTGVATEPERVPILAALGSRFRRGTTAVIAVIVVALAASVALMVRDLDTTAPPPLPSAVPTEGAPAPAPGAAHAPAASPVHGAPAAGWPSLATDDAAPARPTDRALPALPTDHVRPSLELRDEREERLEDDPTGDDEPKQRVLMQQRPSPPEPSPAPPAD